MKVNKYNKKEQCSHCRRHRQRFHIIVHIFCALVYSRLIFIWSHILLHWFFSVKKAIQLSIDKNSIQAFLEDNLINPIIDKKINQLSGGELRYLEIKLVLENDKKFALLDEPYNGLSPIAIENINALILQNKAKKGIIITDHNYKNVIEISTDLYLMKAGALSKIKTTEDLVFHGYLHSIL